MPKMKKLFVGHVIMVILKIAKWLIEISEKKGLGSINIHTCDEHTFRYACYCGYFEIVKWLIEISEEKGLGPINIHACDEDAFRYTCKNGHLEVAKWLLTLYTRKELINLDHSLAKEELENRRKTNIELILYLHKNKFKLHDIHAIAIIWNDYL